MTLNTTHVRGKGVYNVRMTLKLSWCVRVMYLHMCTKFHGSMVNSCRENPFGGVGFSNFMMIGFSSNFHLSFKSWCLVSFSACSKSTFFAFWLLAPTDCLYVPPTCVKLPLGVSASDWLAKKLCDVARWTHRPLISRRQPTVYVPPSDEFLKKDERRPRIVKSLLLVSVPPSMIYFSGDWPRFVHFASL